MRGIKSTVGLTIGSDLVCPALNLSYSGDAIVEMLNPFPGVPDFFRDRGYIFSKFHCSRSEQALIYIFKRTSR